MKKISLYINLCFSIMLCACFALSCTEMSEDDLALDYETLTPSTGSDDSTHDKTGAEILANFKPQYIPSTSSPFVEFEGETVGNLFYDGTSVSELQAKIDAYKNGGASNVLIVHITGSLKVTDTPLTLGSRTVLSFEGINGGISMAGTTSISLIKFTSAECSGIISSGTDLKEIQIDGNGVAAVGVEVANCGKVHIDNVSIARCKYGIKYTGRVDIEATAGEEFAAPEPGVITRCTISNCSERGILASKSCRFVCANNTVTSCGGYGIDITSYGATIHMNECIGNGTAIHMNVPGTGGTYGTGVITRNIVTENSRGIVLGGNTKCILVTENVITGNATGCVLNGKNNRIFDNEFNNTTEVSSVGGSGNIVMRNTDLTYEEMPSGIKYFNPPIKSNPHRDLVISSSRNQRADLDIKSADYTGDEPMSTVEVQKLINDFASKNSNKYLVFWLTGTFVADGIRTGLTVPQWTSIVLDGELYAEGEGMAKTTYNDPLYKEDNGNYGGTQIVLFNNAGCFTSMSGGTVKGHYLPRYDIYAPCDNLLLLDDITIESSNVNHVGFCKHTGEDNPAFLHDCRLYGDNKSLTGVWNHVCNNIVYLGNESYDFRNDFVDLDAGGNNSHVLFNYIENGPRSAIFTEEAVSSNWIMGNYITGNCGSQGTYSTLDPIDGLNSMFNKLTGGNVKGMGFGNAKRCFIFNNQIESGTFGFNTSTYDNYASSNVFWDQEELNIQRPDRNLYFTLPY